MKKSQEFVYIKSKKAKKHTHFVGIGGIGISALAQWYLSEGYKVSGTDMAKSDITEMLKKKGMRIFNFQFSIFNKFSISNFQKQQQGEIRKCIKKAAAVIYSSAVPDNNWELLYAGKLGISVLTYAQALGELTRKYKTICVSGTHGKSTATAMLALIMVKAGLDPTVILGTKLKEFFTRDEKNKMSAFSRNCCKMRTNQIRSRGTGVFYGNNFRKGKSEWLLIEADEYKAAFLNYSPYMIILTNIEEEHLDYYKDLKHILRIYKKYVSRLDNNGVLVTNGDNKNIQRILNPKSEILNPKQIQNSKFKIQNFSFKAEKNINTLREILKVPGEYNVYNALAALTAARALGVNDKISFAALSEYRGAWRRMEPLGNYKNAKIISDYAHNPAKVKAALSVFEGKKKTLIIYQPHHQQRLEKLFDNFVRVFGEARLGTGSQIIITDVYEVAGRDKKSKIKNQKSKSHTKNSKLLVEAINKKYPDTNAIYISKNKLKQWLENKFHIPPSLLAERAGRADSRFQILVFMGAGDIDALARHLAHRNA